MSAHVALTYAERERARSEPSAADVVRRLADELRRAAA